VIKMAIEDTTIYHWKSAIKLTLKFNERNYPLEPVDDLRVRFRSEKDIRDGLSMGNMQKIHRWPRYTFDLRMPAVAKNVGALLWMEFHDADFELEVTEVMESNTSNDLVVKTILLEGCSVEDADIRYVSNDVPIIAFTGVAMRAMPTVVPKGSLIAQPLNFQRGSDKNDADTSATPETDL